VFELKVAAGLSHFVPSILFKNFDDRPAIHSVY
jgi:hypothetical protein